MFANSFVPRTLPLLLATGLLTCPLSVDADEMITASVVAEALNVNTTPMTERDPATGERSTTSGGVNAFANRSAGSSFPNSTITGDFTSSSGSSFANTAGQLRSRSELNTGSTIGLDLAATTTAISPLTTHDLAATALARWNDVVTNTTGVSQDYTLNFLVQNLELSINSGGPLSVTAPGQVYGDPAYYTAELMAQITLNSNAIYEFSARLTADEMGMITGFTSMSDPGGGPSPMWMNNGDGWTAPDFSGALELGTFAPGEELTVEYVAETLVTAAGGGPGDFIPIDGVNLLSRFGDPTGISGGANVNVTNQPATAAVPEPASILTWAMVGLWGLAFGYRRWRRQ